MMGMRMVRIWRKAETTSRWRIDCDVVVVEFVYQRYIASLVHFSEALVELRQPAQASSTRKT